MSKELPYFKFEPNQWDNGNIQMLSREDKGLFIDLCSIYWSRLGDLPVKLASMKLVNGDVSRFDPLLDDVIKIEDDKIIIAFLDEQLNNFGIKSSIASSNAKSRWEQTPERIKGNIVYVIRCWSKDEEFVKIGITSTSINRRFSGKIPYNYEAIIIDEYDDHSLESQYEELAKGCEYIAKKEFSGKLECYTTKCLQRLIEFAIIRNAKYVRKPSENNPIREDKIREEDIPTQFSFRKSLLDMGADKQLVSDWLEVRKKKRSANTQTALNNFKAQVEKSKRPINEVLKLCAENSWAGFNAEWATKQDIEKPKKPGFIYGN